jgi:hypothetical protein
MNDILNKIVKSKSNNKKKDNVYNQIELELQLKIESEKTKQLELIKDIKKIEKSIKQKELYSLRNKMCCKKLSGSSFESNDSYDYSESESDSESETEYSCDNSDDTLSLCSIDSDFSISYLDKEIEIIEHK